jgi:hypothetical protein
MPVGIYSYEKITDLPQARLEEGFLLGYPEPTLMFFFIR